MTGGSVPRSPLWTAIAETLSIEIAEGHYRPGDRLPTEAELAARFGVNRHTVRRGLADLAARGLVHARRGAGVFVAARSTEYPLGRRTRFHQNLAASGQTATREILRLETRASDAREAEALMIGVGTPVHVCEGVSLADGAPIAFFRSVFPARRLPDMPLHLRASHSITAALAAQGIADYTRAWTRLTAKGANPMLATHLRLAQGAPILRSVAVNIGTDGVPVEYGQTWFAGDRVTLTVVPGD
jgi:GntR family transcriptional regulator, phosphonate transport system regulatory protein